MGSVDSPSMRRGGGDDDPYLLLGGGGGGLSSDDGGGVGGGGGGVGGLHEAMGFRVAEPRYADVPGLRYDDADAADDDDPRVFQ